MFKKILVLAPHTDDGEFGCGGSMARFIEEGKEVWYVAFSSAEKSVPPGFPKDILKVEVKKAVQQLGVNHKQLLLYDYPVRDFPLFRQQILEDMISLKRKINPDLVLLPSLDDIHQDHLVIAQEGLRAFKMVSILGYEVLWNNLSFQTRAFVHLDKKHIAKKIKALGCYESQKHRTYASKEFVFSLARTRGTQIGTEYAEVFETIRWIIK